MLNAPKEVIGEFKVEVTAVFVLPKLNEPLTVVVPFTVKLKLLPEAPTERLPPIEVAPAIIIVLPALDELSVTFPENTDAPILIVPEPP